MQVHKHASVDEDGSARDITGEIAGQEDDAARHIVRLTRRRISSRRSTLFPPTRIEPPPEARVLAGRNHNKPIHAESRRAFFVWPAQTITIDAIKTVERDKAFDDAHRYRNGGIRLIYAGNTITGHAPARPIAHK